jgi:hypothetical protein
LDEGEVKDKVIIVKGDTGARLSVHASHWKWHYGGRKPQDAVL